MRHIFNICFLLFVAICYSQRYEDLVISELQVDIEPSFIEGVTIVLKHCEGSSSLISIENYYFEDERIIETVNLHKITTLLNDYVFSHNNSITTDTVFKDGDTLMLTTLGFDGVMVSGALERNKELKTFSFWSPSRESPNGELMSSVFELLDPLFKNEQIKKYLTEVKGCFDGYPNPRNVNAHKEFMIKDEVYMVVEKMPRFKGDVDGLLSYIEFHTKNSEVINQTKIKGKVYVNFVIDEKGQV